MHYRWDGRSIQSEPRVNTYYQPQQTNGYGGYDSTEWRTVSEQERAPQQIFFGGRVMGNENGFSAFWPREDLTRKPPEWPPLTNGVHLDKAIQPPSSKPTAGQSGRAMKPQARKKTSPPVTPTTFVFKGPVKTIDQTVFDKLVYEQEDASTPPDEVRAVLESSRVTAATPNGIIVPQYQDASEARARPAAETQTPIEPAAPPPDEPLFDDIDPRIHWPQRHSEAWYEAKKEEISRRGGRKAQFGKAAQRMHQQRVLDVPLKERAPEKAIENPAWLRMLGRLEEMRKAQEQQQASPPARTKPSRTNSNISSASSQKGAGVNGYRHGINGHIARSGSGTAIVTTAVGNPKRKQVVKRPSQG